MIAKLDFDTSLIRPGLGILLLCVCGLASRAVSAEVRYLDPPLSCENLPIAECAARLTDAIGKKGMIGLGLRCGAAPASEGEEDQEVVFVAELVVEGGAAEQAGLARGDQIVAINGIRAVQSRIDELHRIDDVIYPGDRLSYTVLRGEGEVEIEVVAVPINTEIGQFQVGKELETIYGHEAAWTHFAEATSESGKE